MTSKTDKINFDDVVKDSVKILKKPCHFGHACGLCKADIYVLHGIIEHCNGCGNIRVLSKTSTLDQQTVKEWKQAKQQALTEKHLSSIDEHIDEHINALKEQIKAKYKAEIQESVKSSIDDYYNEMSQGILE